MENTQTTQTFRPLESLTPAEMTEEMNQLKAKLELNDSSITPDELRRAVELTRALRKTHTGPARTRKKSKPTAVSLDDMLD